MTTTSTPPADPETAALDLIVRIAEAVPGAGALRAALHDFAGALHIEAALGGLVTMADARLAAATIAEAACTADDPVGALRIRGAAIRAGCWDCADPESLAQALDGAATVLDAL
ncbi:amino acid aminotransferase [Mycobacterium syngnathidarum]